MLHQKNTIMKLPTFLAKLSVLLLFLFSSPSLLLSQWVQSSGPQGGMFKTVTTTSTGLAAYGSSGTFLYENETWKNVSNFVGDHIVAIGEVLIGTKVEGQQHILYRSTDKGITWDSLGLTSTLSVLSTTPISVVDGTAYVVVNDTLLKSLDGINWEVQAPLPPFSHAIFGSSDRLYAPVGFFGSELYTSVDGGLTWEPTAANPPATGSGGLQYAGGEGAIYASATTSLYQSTDNGATWEDITEGLPGFARIQWIAANDQALFAGSFGKSIGRFVNGTWDMIPMNSYALSPVVDNNGAFFPTQAGIYRVENASSDVENITTNLRNTSVGALGNVTSELNSAVFASTGNAIFRTTDEGNQWERVADLQAFSFESYNDLIFAVDYGDIYRSTDLGETWVSMQTKFDDYKMQEFGGTEFSLAFSGITVDDNGTAYLTLAETLSEHELNDDWREGGIFRSTDKGETWQEVNQGLPENGFTVVPITDALALGNNVVYISTLEGVYRSTNRGDSWTKSIGGLPVDDQWKGTGSFFLLNGSIYLYTPRGIFTRQNPETNSTWTAVAPIPDNYSIVNPLGDEANILNGRRYVRAFHWDGSASNYKTFAFDGTTWIDVENEMPNNVILQVFLQVGDRGYAGSEQQSVWITDIQSGVQMAERNQASAIYVTPNPATTEATLYLDLNTSLQFTKVILVNSIGEQVSALHSGPLSAGTHQFRIGTDIPSGYYRVVVVTEGTSWSHSLVKTN